MARGYLACWNNLPPLVFRFQFNPESLQEKKGYKYTEVESFGNWDFDKTTAAANDPDEPWYFKLATVPAGVSDDLKEIGPMLTRTHPLEARCGEQRVFNLEFALEAGIDPEGATAGVGNLYERSIETDIELLRSFMYPGVGAGELVKWIGDAVNGRSTKAFPPPLCTLIYGGINADCVMENLSIKVTRFNPDTSPARAEVSITLKQQTLAIDPIFETITRYFRVAKSMGRDGYGTDYLNTLPGASVVKHIFDL